MYSALIAAAELHLVANPIITRLLSTTTMSAKEALKLNSHLTGWSAALPPYFQLNCTPVSSLDWYLFARSRLWWKFWNLQITLTRPALHRWVLTRFGSNPEPDSSPEELECRILCIASAHETITSVARFIDQHPQTMVVSWYTLYVGLSVDSPASRATFLPTCTNSPADILCSMPL